MNIKILCHRRNCIHWYKGNCDKTTITLFIDEPIVNGSVGCADYHVG
jgi:hypothetical protein